MVQLACQPADGKVLYGHEIEILFRTALVEVGLEPPSSREAAGWTLARGIAACMIEGVVPPAEALDA